MALHLCGRQAVLYGRASRGLRSAAPAISSSRPVGVSGTLSSSSSGWQQQQRRRSQHCAVRATDDDSATSSDTGGATAGVSAIERARRALAADTPQRDELEAALSDIEQELQSLRETSSTAEGQSASLQASVASSKDQLLRLTADFENFRRRTAQQNTQLAESTRGDVIKQLLPIIDGFEQARTQVKAETEAEQKINNSYQGLYKQMVDLMRSLGVEPVPTVGSQFDPEVHEAIMRESSSSHPDGTVLVEFRKGFRIGDKLLRPAMVQVSYQEEATGASNEE